MKNPDPQAGDIWLYMDKTYIFILCWDYDDDSWLAHNLSTGKNQNWFIDLDEPTEAHRWRFVA